MGHGHKGVVGAHGAQCLLLLLHDHHQTLQALIHVTLAQANVDRHVHGVVPGAWVDLHPLVAQAHHARLVLVRGDQEQDALEELFHALGQDPRGQLNAALACADGGGHRCLGARLQCVSIQTHRGLAHAGAVFLDLVHIVQHGECGLAHKGGVEWLHHAGGTHTNDSARLVVEHVINVDLALNNRGPGVD